jgi:hypothetical protein
MPKVSPSRFSDPRRATRTRQEAARLIGCAPNTVTIMVLKGQLASIEAGNRQLVTVSSLEALLGRPISELEADAGRDAA